MTRNEIELINLIEGSNLFNPLFYLKEYSDVRVSDLLPLEHYIKFGIKENRKPNSEFDPIWYKKYYNDLEGNSPIIHYIKIGMNENRFKSHEEKLKYETNNIKITKIKQKNLNSLEEAFDENFYLKTYKDIYEAGVNPFEHYLSFGWKEGRLPNEWFEPLFYINKYEDVKNSNIEPLTHYIEIGQHEKRETKEFKITELDESIKALIPKITFDSTKNEFMDYKKNQPLNSPIKTIAFYLPQFHPFPENDEWWGKGFTEWTNVTKAKPNFKDHYQPHLPIHNGFYDLRIPEVMIEQAKLAKNYGIYGFNFYYYWFDGKILMHKPFEILLQHKEIDINFCITWANENWSRRWDGAENDVLIGQHHCDSDSIAFLENLYKFFNDERYIRIDNKPILIIYRADIIPNIENTLKLWREKAVSDGFDGLYIICSQTFGIKSPLDYGFDAAMEFPPHTVKSTKINNDLDIINKEFDGSVYDYNQVVKNACEENEPEYKVFKTVMLSWDNTARKQNNSHTFANFNLLNYKQWFSNKVYSTLNNQKYKEDEKLVFINAWNEWAEGTHLEPDRKFGYNYLQTTYDVLKNTEITKEILNKKLEKKNNNAMILHIHFTDLWEELNSYIKNLKTFGFDLYITLTNVENNIIDNILSIYPEANIMLVENRGRDILPFINIYKKIQQLNYDAICKIHSKKSQYRDDGNKIRNELYETLLGNENIIQNILDTFKESNIGLITNKKYLLKHTDHNMTYDKEIVRDLSDYLKLDFKYDIFPAGSMFWFKSCAFNDFEKIEDRFFGIEEGLADGTIAHSIERLFCNIVKTKKYSIKGL